MVDERKRHGPRHVLDLRARSRGTFLKAGPDAARLRSDWIVCLGGDFRKLGELHAAEHDVFHQSRTFAKQCAEHAEKLRPIVERYGRDAPGDGEPGLWESVMGAVRRRASEAAGRRPDSGLLLVHDLRDVYLSAQETYVTWLIVHQGAQAARDRELLQVSGECQLETELQVKWLLMQIKVQSPQALMV